MERNDEIKAHANPIVNRLVFAIGITYLSMMLGDILFSFFQNKVINILQILLMISVLWGTLRNRGWARRFVLFSAGLTIISIPVSLYHYFFIPNSPLLNFPPALSANWVVTIALLYFVVSIWLIYLLMRVDVRNLFSEG
jgi:hypothetical protein